MALNVLRIIATSLQSSFLTVMIDETMDVSNHEQVVLVFQRITDDFQVFEEFIGLHSVDSIQLNAFPK